MRPLLLNFAPASRRYTRGTTPALLVALALTGAAALFAWSSHEELKRSDPRPTVQLSTAPTAIKAQDLAARIAVSQAIVHLNFPILDFLAALEAPRGFGVHMMNLDVRMTAGGETPLARARVTAQARGLRQAADYVDHLSRHPRLGETQLVRHEFIDGDRPGLVQFVVEVAWLNTHEK
jgi:hypothetical protein